ncbi:MAG: hypothetical protein RR346_00575 [Bacteroidales bacterium]
MKKIILSVMMVFALATATTYAQAPAKGCGGCKTECTAQQKATCQSTDAKKDGKDKKDKKAECTKKECPKTKADCSKEKQNCPKDAKKPACCKKEAEKK